MLLTELAVLLNGTVLQNTDAHPTIQHLLLDSRKIVFPQTALFFAIRGLHHNGHRFLKEAYQKGVRNFVVSQTVDVRLFPEANLIQVDDSVKALQQLAAHHRGQFDLPVIGITGSNGKTVVKEWLFQLLRHHFYIVRSPQSYNSQIGVPLSIWQIEAEHQLGIFEAGISQPNEMEQLANIIGANIGIFTNIGQAHGEGFDNRKQKVAKS